MDLNAFLNHLSGAETAAVFLGVPALVFVLVSVLVLVPSALQDRRASNQTSSQADNLDDADHVESK